MEIVSLDQLEDSGVKKALGGILGESAVHEALRAGWRVWLFQSVSEVSDALGELTRKEAKFALNFLEERIGEEMREPNSRHSWTGERVCIIRGHLCIPSNIMLTIPGYTLHEKPHVYVQRPGHGGIH